jgi:hypothetical protein
LEQDVMVGQACEAAVCVAWFLLSSPPDRHSTQHAARSTQESPRVRKVIHAVEVLTRAIAARC